MRGRVVLILVLAACSGGGGGGGSDARLTDAEVAADASPDAAADAPGADACAVPLACPGPLATKLTICGRLADAETGQPVGADAGTTACDPESPTATGPCSLRLRFYDAFAFTQNPTGATPIVPTSLVLDGCGRFRAESLSRPSTGFVGIVVDDAGAADAHRASLLAIANAAATPASGVTPLVVRTATDTAWTTTAGIGSPTFAERGVALVVFAHLGMARPGVTVQRAGSPIPTDDYYFSDANADRTTIAPAQTSTGTSGSALIINSASPAEHAGLGGEPDACAWPTHPVATIAGVVSVFRFDATCP